MTNPPDQPFGGVEYPSLDPHAPVDYPADPPSPPPSYPPPPIGYPGYPYDPYRAVKPPGTNGKAIASLIVSLVGALLCGLPSVAGIVLGVIAMRETRLTRQDGYGIALAGLIIGAVVVAFWVIYLIVAAASYPNYTA